MQLERSTVFTSNLTVNSMQQFLIIIEKTPRNYSAYSPDFPGVVATGRSSSSTKRAMERAVAFHIEGMLKEGLSVPKGLATSSYISVGK